MVYILDYMRFKIIYTFVALGCIFQLNAQVISLFNWNGSNPATADYGPNALSINSSAKINQGGVNGTTGLNAGLPKGDIEMLLPNSAFANIDGIDFRIDFQRDENRGDFISSGTRFAFGMNSGALYIKFEKDDTAGGTETIEVNNIYSIPDDDTFRTYRFYYLPDNGTAKVLVDDSVVWSNTYSSPAPFIWSNDDIMIGRMMDGNGKDKTIFDNMILGEVDDAALPVKLNRFEANQQLGDVILEWETVSETNNNYFTIERSQHGDQFNSLNVINGAGTSTKKHCYKYIDKNPLSGISYYRLRQTDFNGESTLSKTISVHISESTQLSIFPNIVSAGSTVKAIVPDDIRIERVFIMTANGNRIGNLDTTFTANQFTISSPALSGTYFVFVISQNGVMSKKLIVR